MKRTATILLVTVLMALIIGHREVQPAQGTSWGSTGAIPGTDPYTNIFPKLLQSNNGSVWLVWEKVSNGYGQIYLMVNNGFGWSGQVPLVNSNGAFDDISPALVQLANGTFILAWSRGVPGTGCLITGAAYSLYTESYTNGKWTNPTPLVQATSGDDVNPAMTRLNDGRVMLAWTRCTTTNGRGDIYYKIFNGIWGPEIPLVATPAEDKLPSIVQMNDGKVWVIYSTNTGTGSSNVLNDVIWNGTTWTSPAQLTNAGVDDDWSSIAQDRNGTIWLFWSRNVFNGTVSGVPTYQYDLFYRNSTNNGLAWSPDQTLAPNINSQDLEPSVIQTNTKRLWLVYSSDQKQGNPYHSNNLYLITSDIVKIHDLAATSFTLPANYPFHRVGDVMNLSVTVANLGDYTESTRINCYANNTIIYGQPFTVTAGQTTTVTVSWNSTGGLPGYYNLRALIIPVQGEFLTSNNSINASTSLPLSFRGDVNRDGKVDIADLSTVAAHFGSVLGSTNYLAAADLNGNGKIDIVDLTLCATDFGKVLAIHDLAILSITPPAVNPRIGEIIKITATVANQGGFTESTQVSLYLNSALISTQPLTVSAGQNIVLTFSWNSTGLNAARYTVTVRVTPVIGELSTSNNSLNSTILLTFRGDVNRDGKVDIADLSTVASHFGTVLGGANYLAAADLNRDGKIDIVDLAMCSTDFGKIVP